MKTEIFVLILLVGIIIPVSAGSWGPSNYFEGNPSNLNQVNISVLRSGPYDVYNGDMLTWSGLTAGNAMSCKIQSGNFTQDAWIPSASLPSSGSFTISSSNHGAQDCVVLFIEPTNPVSDRVLYYRVVNTTRPVIPSINFNGSPTNGFAPLNVSFNATSNQTNTIWLWNFGDGQQYNGSVSTPSHSYNQIGNYTVRLDTYSSGYGWYNLTKVNYIAVTNTGGVLFNLDIKDSISGSLVQDTTIGIKNTTSGVWRNSTAPTGLIYYDTTDPGDLYPLSVNQSVTVAASKTGYKNTSLTFSIPYNNYRAYLYMVPSWAVNATGKGIVVATVVKNKDGLPLSGTSVTLNTGQMGITNSAGAVTLMNVTAGTPTATAILSGYQTTSSTFNLSAGETKLVVIQMVANGETPVPTYGSPTPTRTPGPGDPDYAGVNSSSGALNERGSTGLMEMMGMIIQLWPLVLIILFMKFMKDAFS